MSRGPREKPCARDTGSRHSPDGGGADEREHDLRAFPAAEESQESLEMS